MGTRTVGAAVQGLADGLDQLLVVVLAVRGGSGCGGGSGWHGRVGRHQRTGRGVVVHGTSDRMELGVRNGHRASHTARRRVGRGAGRRALAGGRTAARTRVHGG